MKKRLTIVLFVLLLAILQVQANANTVAAKFDCMMVCTPELCECPPPPPINPDFKP